MARLSLPGSAEIGRFALIAGLTALAYALAGWLSLKLSTYIDLPARQQALRDTIDWSFELLDAREQRLFVLLSVFSGGWLVRGGRSRSERG